MKKIFFTLLLFLCIVIKSNSQIKILFDASKAETASNADWVIDSDVFNLGYNDGPAELNGGNEGNAQQIPNPSQSGINSSTSETYWKGALSAWGVELVQNGYYVETLPYNGNITYGNTSNSQDLSNYKVFIICEPNIVFTSDEKVALINFVENGGGLFIISDHDNSDRNGDGWDSPAIWNDLFTNNSVQTNPFGITFDLEFFDDATTNMANLPNDSILHGEIGDVTLVEFYGGTSMTINSSQNSTVEALVYKSGTISGNLNILMASARYGQGKVVAIGDSSPADDGSGDNNDNLYDGWVEDANGNHRKLLMNATIWLAAENNINPININSISEDIIFQLNGNKLFKIVTEKSQTYSVEIYDITGKKVYSNDNVNIFESYSLENFNYGIFIYRIKSDDNILKTGKFVIY